MTNVGYLLHLIRVPREIMQSQMEQKSVYGVLLAVHLPKDKEYSYGTPDLSMLSGYEALHVQGPPGTT